MTSEYTMERAAAVDLLAKGLATPSEVAHLAGVSRQLVQHWTAQAGIDWRHAREERLSKEWQKRLQRG
jgi:DNA invertase Pin-like site-specific DNA recombinase